MEFSPITFLPVILVFAIIIGLAKAQQCSSDEFQCNNGDCIPERFQCDGFGDCPDISDEQSCVFTPSIPVCDFFTYDLYDGDQFDGFQCASGRCIPKANRCDGNFDCPDLDDEQPEDCSCDSNEILCANTRCISASRVCDGTNDCGDRSDEEHCTVDCGSLSNPSNGQVSLSGTRFGSTATYICNSGFDRVGSATRTCQANGMWSGTAPTCQADCGSLPNPFNGRVMFSRGTTSGSIATYTCNSGFSLVGSTTRLCQTTATWSGTAPFCRAVDCGSLASPSNGRFFLSGTTFGSTATYTCNSGFGRVGSATRTCQATGTWSGTAPTCQADCGSLSNPSNGRVTFSRGTTSGSVATYTCNSGFGRVGSATRTCQTTGMWSGTAPFCRVVDCGSLSDPSNGQVSLSGTTFGSTATYTCRSGFGRVGSATRTCQASGTWSGTAPTCQADCGSLSNPSNGRVTFSRGTTSGSTATYTCNSGFGRVGSATRLCQTNGTWSGTAPVCEVVDCGRLSDPSNGQVSLSGTTNGSTATYICNSGFGHVGSATRTCQATGMWSGTAPTCQIVDCGSLSDPFNGQVTLSNGTTLTAVATYTCNPGFDLVGSATRTCQANGTWSGTAPVCAVDCGSLSNPNNGLVSLSGTTLGSTATYTCRSGFDRVGSATRTCQATGMWSGTAPVCEDALSDSSESESGSGVAFGSGAITSILVALSTYLYI